MKVIPEGEGGIRGVRAGEAYAEAQVFDVAQSWVEPGVGRWWGFGPFGNGGSRPSVNPQDLIEPARERVTHNRKRGTGSIYYVLREKSWRAKGPNRGNGGEYVGTFPSKMDAEAALDAWLLEHKGVK